MKYYSNPEIFPDSKDNIYPKNIENIEAIMSFFFPNLKLEAEFLLVTKLSTNQIEFIAKKTAENLEFFKTNVGINGLTIINLMNYGISAITVPSENWTGSVERKRILKEFKLIVG
jgi:hypothetical protein